MSLKNEVAGTAEATPDHLDFFKSYFYSSSTHVKLNDKKTSKKISEVPKFHQAKTREKQSSFTTQSNNNYQEISTPKFSKLKITLSIALFVLPFVISIRYFPKSKLASQVATIIAHFPLPIMGLSYYKSYRAESLAARINKLSKNNNTFYQKALLLKKYYKLIEGVPFTL